MLKAYYKEGVIEAGCDEAGRGPLAGSVYAAAVILPPDYKNEKLNDSKKLTEKQRYALREEIERDAIAWALGIVTPKEIDEMNILRASITAMHRALDGLKVRPEYIIVDGNRFYPYKAPQPPKGEAILREDKKPVQAEAQYPKEAILAESENAHQAEAQYPKEAILAESGNAHQAEAQYPKEAILAESGNAHQAEALPLRGAGGPIPHTTIVKGDGKYLSIAAASILAKTYRDDYMKELHKEYPMYGWDKNAGYPTKAHREAIKQYGTTPYHRMSFNLLGSAQLELKFE